MGQKYGSRRKLRVEGGIVKRKRINGGAVGGKKKARKTDEVDVEEVEDVLETVEKESAKNDEIDETVENESVNDDDIVTEKNSQDPAGKESADEMEDENVESVESEDLWDTPGPAGSTQHSQQVSQESVSLLACTQDSAIVATAGDTQPSQRAGGGYGQHLLGEDAGLGIGDGVIFGAGLGGSQKGSVEGLQNSVKYVRDMSQGSNSTISDEDIEIRMKAELIKAKLVNEKVKNPLINSQNGL